MQPEQLLYKSNACKHFLGKIFFAVFLVQLFQIGTLYEKKYFRAPFLVLQVVTNRRLYSVPAWKDQMVSGRTMIGILVECRY